VGGRGHARRGERQCGHASERAAIPADPVSAALVATVAPLRPYFSNPYQGYGFAYTPPHDGLALNIGLNN
jgi:hypothetical protein